MERYMHSQHPWTLQSLGLPGDIRVAVMGCVVVMSLMGRNTGGEEGEDRGCFRWRSKERIFYQFSRTLADTVIRNTQDHLKPKETIPKSICKGE